jgi:thymidylate kinase
MAMRVVPIKLWNNQITVISGDRPAARLENPVLAKVIRERRNHFSRPENQNLNLLKKITAESRVIILEGVSGSGKDTFQMYLKKMIKGRDVYDYSEGELLQSWKQLQIEGIFNLRIKLMKLFVNYVKDFVSQDENAVFLLNRFHLSTYASTIVHQPKLRKEYDEIISVLRTLPVHVFILQLNESEMQERCSHPERSTAWQTYQKQIAKKEGFPTSLGRHIWQQGLILDAAERQQIPYSVIKLSSSSELGGVKARVSETQRTPHRSALMTTGDSQRSQIKQSPPRTFQEDY